MTKVFLSFSFTDPKWPHRVAALLRTAGMEVDAGMYGHDGYDTPRELLRAIRSSDVLVALDSDRFSCGIEVGFAMACGVPVVCIARDGDDDLLGNDCFWRPMIIGPLPGEGPCVDIGRAIERAMARR